MASVLQRLGKSPDAPPRDPVQRQQGYVFLQNQRSPPPGSWTDNRLAQSQHYTGTIFLALSAMQELMASGAYWCERRKRRDRTTFGPGGSVAVVKALSTAGGAGNDEDYAPVQDHPLADILRRPNSNETFAAMIGYLTLQWGLTGNAPLWLVPGQDHGRPVELYPLVEALLQPAHGPSERYPEGAWRVTPYYPGGMSWAYGTLGARLATSPILPGREVRKLKAPHPLTRSDGYSPLSACGVQFDVMEAIDNSRHSAFSNGAQLGTLIYVPGLDEASNNRATAAVREMYVGSRNARRPAVLSSPPGAQGEFKVERDPPPREMDYVTSWEQATRVVLAVFGQHAAVAGLKDTTGYAELYAAQMQVWMRGSGLVRQWSDFFTMHLAGPWSKKPGEYRIKGQLPKPRNEEAQQQGIMQLASSGGVMVNEARAVFDLAPIACGDLPLSVYLKKVESIEFPQEQQGMGGEMPPGADGSAVPAEGQEADEQPQDDSPEATQDATVQAALSALGVPGEGSGSSAVEKAIRVTKPGGAGRVKRNEGDRWEAGGRWWTKKNGKIVETAAPGTARPVGGKTEAPQARRYPSRHTPDVTYANPADRDADDRAIDRAKQKQVAAQAEVDRLKTAIAEASKDPHQQVAEARKRLAAAEQKVREARAAAIAARSRAGEAGPSPSAATPAEEASTLDALPLDKLHHAIATSAGAKKFGLTPQVLARMPEAAVRSMGAQLGIKGAESSDGGHFAAAAKSVPASTPTAVKTLQTVDQWAASHAERHADRVAAHFGIPRELATRLLTDAITRVAQHAAANGGSLPQNVSIRDKRTGKTATLTPQTRGGPTAGAAPRPANPAAKGSLPPRVGKAVRRQRFRHVAARTIAAIEQE